MSLGTIFEVSLDPKTGWGSPMAWESQILPPDFRPHGISYTRIAGIPTLFVISHTYQDANPHVVEVFQKEKTLGWQHKKTLRHPSLTSPNDLYALPNGDVYVSNDRGTGVA